MFNRPYRNVNTDTLQELYDRAVLAVDDLQHRRHGALTSYTRRLIRDYGRELTKRSKETT